MLFDSPIYIKKIRVNYTLLPLKMLELHSPFLLC